MRLEDSGLQSFHIAKRFAEAYETQAHTIPTICEESNQIMKTYNDISRLADAKVFNPKFYYRKDINPEMETRNYPNLLYCELYKLKAGHDNQETGWANYVGNITATLHP